MSPHVAEASERRGRVVVSITREPAPWSLECAVAIARAYAADIESVFIEDTDQLQFSKLPFARVVSPGGRSITSICERDLRYAFAGLKRRAAARLQALGAAADVTVRIRDVAAQPVRAVNDVCAAEGPWNIVVLADQVTRDGFARATEIFLRVPDVTAVVAVGRDAGRTRGPVVVAIDRIDDLDAMLKAARRLAEAAGSGVAIVPCAATRAEDTDIDGQVRLAANTDPAAFADTVLVASAETHGEPAALARTIQVLRPSLVITRLGGVLLPDAAAFALLTGVIGCPLLMAR